MITVDFFQDRSGSLRGFQSEGHAGADEYGYDIVCSAVSALTLNTANSIEALTGAAITEEAEENGGFLRVMLTPETADDPGAQLLLKSLMLGISQMADSYPENLRIRHIER